MISIDPSATDIMNRDAEQAFPDECCGFMYGEQLADGDRVVTTSVPVINASAANRKRRFEISPRDYLKAEHYAIEHDLQLLGVYHSHPNHPAQPSEHDRVAAQPWFSYVIISVQEGSVDHTRSWVLNDQSQFDEEKIHQTTVVNK